MEEVCVVERKDLSDLVHSLTAERPAFINRLRRMSTYPQRLLAVTAPLSTLKSSYSYSYSYSYSFSNSNPNRIMQSLVAVLTGWKVPFVCTETHELGEEMVASYLYQVHLYHWLKSNGHGRFLSDGDL
jgi:ERCC4-type nuclease